MNPPDPAGLALPPDQSPRFATLRRLGLLDPSTEPALNRVTRLASRFLGVPVSLVSFVDDHRVYFKGRAGVPDSWGLDEPSPRPDSICSVVLRSPGPLVIDDAQAHEEVKAMPAVTQLGVAAYMGVPLVAADGLILGSLCAIDLRPRRWTPEEVDILVDLAGLVMSEVQLRDEIAERVQAEAARAGSQATEEAANRRADRILASITDGFFALDRDWRFTYLNPQCEPLMDRRPADLLGRVFWDEFPAAVGSRFERQYRLVVDSGQAVNFEEYYPPLKAWYEIHALSVRRRPGGLFPEYQPAAAGRADPPGNGRTVPRPPRRGPRPRLDPDERGRDHPGVARRGRADPRLDQGGGDRPAWVDHLHPRGPRQRDRRQGVRPRRRAGTAADIRWHIRKDGSQFFADGVMARLNDDAGKINGFAKVFQDATARKVAEDTLADQAEALKQADIRKNEFLAMLAHELRNPLAAIRNALGVARSGQKADLDWGLEVIGRQMRSFTHLIDDLLDVSRITQGKIQLRKVFATPGRSSATPPRRSRRSSTRSGTP